MTNINRDSEGKFTSNKWFITKFLGLPALFVIVGVSIAMYYQHQHPNIITNTIEKDISPEMYAQKIDSLEKSVVKQVEQCESNGYTESDALVSYDPRESDRATVKGTIVVDKGQMSYGVLQFKTKTVQYYYKSLYGKTLTNLEAILVALNASSSEALAQDIMFTSPKMGLTDWTVCSNSLNLGVMITAIKKIK